MLSTFSCFDGTMWHRVRLRHGAGRLISRVTRLTTPCLTCLPATSSTTCLAGALQRGACSASCLRGWLAPLHAFHVHSIVCWYWQILCGIHGIHSQRAREWCWRPTILFAGNKLFCALFRTFCVTTTAMASAGGRWLQDSIRMLRGAMLVATTSATQR